MSAGGIRTHDQVAASRGMKCRENGGNTSKQDFNDVVRACMANLHEEGNVAMKKPGNNNYFNTRNDENRNEFHGQRRPHNQAGHHNRGTAQQQFDNRKGGGYRDDSDESLYPPHYNGFRPISANNNNGFGSGNYYTAGRNPSSGSNNNPFETNRGNKRQNNTNTNNNNHNNREPSKHGGASPLEDIEPCIIHCVFQQMRMLGSGSKPDKNSVLSVMTQKIRNPELREFIQDSVNDCFEAVESEPQYQIGKCDFSKKLALCMEEKGQQNCEDWDEEDDDDANNKRKGNNPNINRYPNNGINNNNNYNSNPRPNNNPYRG
ncbi:general odorant-binding protein 71 isoform X3 [Nilaparvata lugens]|uniref:general odorant-binding protein 71 isoform X3 n=1 Tax=Nilaparvata lugens TaxID=108931 RepID=UPI00193D4279|nr:general odorant-binding protein 71 isoform X3 [Nilaparvata lugens]